MFWRQSTISLFVKVYNLNFACSASWIIDHFADQSSVEWVFKQYRPILKAKSEGWVMMKANKGDSSPALWAVWEEKLQVQHWEKGYHHLFKNIKWNEQFRKSKLSYIRWLKILFILICMYNMFNILKATLQPQITILRNRWRLALPLTILHHFWQ